MTDDRQRAIAIAQLLKEAKANGIDIHTGDPKGSTTLVLGQYVIDFGFVGQVTLRKWNGPYDWEEIEVK